MNQPIGSGRIWNKPETSIQATTPGDSPLDHVRAEGTGTEEPFVTDDLMDQRLNAVLCPFNYQGFWAEWKRGVLGRAVSH